MRLIQCVSLTANNLRVRCVACNRWYDFNHVFADLNGAAFVDYYCGPCANEVPEPCEHCGADKYEESKPNCRCIKEENMSHE